MGGQAPRRPRMAAVLLAGALALGGCGGATESRTEPEGDPSLAAMVPADLRERGRIVVATDASYPPMEFKDSKGRLVGVDIDLGREIAAELGLEAEFKNARFDGIIGGVQAGKYDLAISDFAATKEREKAVDMVTYFSSGSAVAVKAGNPEKLDPDLLCGVRVAVQAGSIQADDIKDNRNPACVRAGKAPIPGDGDRYDLQTQVTEALLAGRVSAMIADTVVVDYAINQFKGRFERLGTPYDISPSAIVVPKGDGQLTQAVQGAVQNLIDDGTYGQVLEKWGVAANGIAKSVINGAPH
ncbi:ABC transporter substrate-binding protein [Streptomyces sp. NPDC051907]|uniref:ABC transporter substrate-binding protein n=1 Tax=Streptomyces sp. NPDC051907 TaxID=3155284 RepID=UPI00342C5436